MALRSNAGYGTQRRTTVCCIPLDEWRVRRRDLYLSTHKNHNRQTSLPPVGFEPTIPAGERPQTCALDRAATGTGHQYECKNVNIKETKFWPLFLLPSEEAVARILLMHFIKTLLSYCKSSTAWFYCKNWFAEKNWNSYRLNYLRASHTHFHTKKDPTFCPLRKNESVNTKKFGYKLISLY